MKSIPTTYYVATPRFRAPGQVRVNLDDGTKAYLEPGDEVPANADKDLVERLADAGLVTTDAPASDDDGNVPASEAWRDDYAAAKQYARELDVDVSLNKSHDDIKAAITAHLEAEEEDGDGEA